MGGVRPHPRNCSKDQLYSTCFWTEHFLHICFNVIDELDNVGADIDTDILIQSVEKLLNYHEKQKTIPTEYLTDENILMWTKLKQKKKKSYYFDDAFRQKIHKIWSIWDDAAIADEEKSSLEKAAVSKQTFKIRALNK